MNILIPHSWLLEHLETSATSSEIQKYLSLSGPSVERIYEIEGEPVYDIEVTTNRVDCMSVRGIAREAAVILTQAGIPSTLKDLAPLPDFIQNPSLKRSKTIRLPVIENDPQLCERIMCVVLSDVKHLSSPLWMQTRLKQIGVNVHDSIIDITNYVTHDLGYACHAFDYDKIIGIDDGMIKVVKAKKGKEFTTLDGNTYETVGGEVVFESKYGQIIDLPGIKGTLNTGISSETKNVLFWMEYIEPTLIRFASMTHAIRTVAAALNERGPDKELMPIVLGQATELLKTYAKATVNPETFFDEYPTSRQIDVIEMPLARIEQYLGLQITPETIQEILETLGCSVQILHGTLTVTAPSWRPDIEISEDVIEEIARIWGYHNLPSKLMATAIPTERQPDTNFTLEKETKALLAALGGYEVYTYSLVSEAIKNQEMKILNLSSGDSHLKLKNPLTEDLTYLRRSLWASHLQILKTQTPKFVFELANTYLPGTEELHLTLSSTGDERVLKGILNAILAANYLPPVHFEIKSQFETLIHASDALIGSMIMVPEEKLTAIDLNWKAIVAIARKYPVVKPIPKVSPIIEDMTFAFNKPFLMQEVTSEIKSISELIERVEFKNSFKQNASFAIIYQPQGEMNAVELAPIRKQIVETLKSKFGAEIIGKI